MLDTLLSIVFTTLFLTFVTSYLILRVAVSERPYRRLLLFLVIFTPLVAIYAFARALFCPPRLVRYSAELGRIEDEIENERAKVFGGKVIRPSFSEAWRASYLYAIEKSAAAAARLEPSIAKSVCGIAQLR
jgi:hypothetical protein